MKKLFFPFVLFFSFTAFVNAQSSAPNSGLKVEVMVFSGRPNPVFVITNPAQVREILALADAMPRAAAGSGGVTKQGLGYRGILVTNLSGDVSDIQAIKLHRSAVEIKRNAATRSKNDTAKSAASETSDARNDNGNALEARLLALAQAYGVIDQRLLNQISAK